MASRRAIETDIPNPTSGQPKRVDPLLLTTFTHVGSRGQRKMLPTSLTLPASLWGAGEGGREMGIAPWKLQATLVERRWQ